MKARRFMPLSIAALFILLSVSMLRPVAANSNYINDAYVSVPACSGVDGRITVTFTIDDSPERFLSVSLGGIQDDVGTIYTSGTFIRDYQFIPREGTSPDEVLTVTVNLGTNFGLGDLDNYTFSFHCDTGEKIIGATGPIANGDNASTVNTVPVLIDVAANDVDFDGNLDRSSVIITTNPASGTVLNKHDGTVLYTPQPGFLDWTSFTYKICDTTHFCSITSVNIKMLAASNRPPICIGAHPSIAMIWPANKLFKPVNIVNVSDDDDDAVAIAIIYIYQDEPVTSRGIRESDVTSPDALGIGTQTAQVRAERNSIGGGRFYHIGFVADDGHGGTCEGKVRVVVPTNPNRLAFDSGALYNSLLP